MISIIKNFEDLSSYVNKKDGYLNVYSVISTTKTLIKEMIEHTKITYEPSNIQELKEELTNNVLTKKNRKFYVQPIGFNNLMIFFDDIIDYLELNKKPLIINPINET